MNFKNMLEKKLPQEDHHLIQNQLVSTGISELEKIYLTFDKNRHLYSTNYNKTIDEKFQNFINFEYDVKKSQEKKSIILIDHLKSFKNELESLIDNLSFLSSVNDNIVVIGPNGSGKSTYIKNLIRVSKELNISLFQAERTAYFNREYSSQKQGIEKAILAIESNINTIFEDMHSALFYNTNYFTQMINILFDEFNNLNSASVSTNHHQINLSHRNIFKKVNTIWTEIFPDKKITLFKSMPSISSNDKLEPYSIERLSTGERNVLYILCRMFIFKQSEYYFIDEPEIGINPSLSQRLWDIIEREFPNSIFVYLTHDKHFAVTRTNSTFFWMKNWDGVNNWEFKKLPQDTNNTLPKELIIELVGNTRPIIFCESEDYDKLDYQIFNVLFPKFKVVPSNGCENVIAKTKAYKRLDLPEVAFGIIDRDFNSESYLEGQKRHNVFPLEFHEIENFLLCEKILTFVLNIVSSDPNNDLTNIKNTVINNFHNDIPFQSLKHTYSLINSMFFSTRINREHSIDDLRDKLETFKTESLDTDKIYNDRTAELNIVHANNDYDEILKYFKMKNFINEVDFLITYNDKYKGKKYKNYVSILISSDTSFIDELKELYFKDIN